MFSYVFTKQKEISPIFEVSSIPFKIYRSSNFLSLEYLGKSYKEAFYNVYLIINEQLIDFNFCFNIFNNSFSVPLEGSLAESDRIPIEIEIVAEEMHISPFAGLENLGATCYINSLLQTIYFLTSSKAELYQSEGYHSLLLQRLFYSLDKVNSMKNKDIVSDKVKIDNEDSITADKGTISDNDPINICTDLNLPINPDITTKIYKANSQSITDHLPAMKDRLYNFIKNLEFVKHISEHQDVHEFSKFLFEALEKENKNLTQKSIEGTVVSIVQCEYGCISKTKQPFQDLQMVIKDCFQDKTNRSIYESLQEFCRATEVEGFQCEKHGKVVATKKVLFSKLPPALFLLLNRFSMDWESEKYIKINEKYEFPEELDFSEFIEDDRCDFNGGSSNGIGNIGNGSTDNNGAADNNGTSTSTGTSTGASDNKYKLFSVIVHSGVVDEGHFFCYLKLNQKYYKFNDETVSECSKYEAVDWNFGGNYPHRPEKEKHFSAYYLVYCNQDQMPCFDVDKLISKKAKIAFESPLEPFTINYLDNENVVGYAGPGRFNIDDTSYPMTSFKTMNCYQTDNLCKIFPKKSVFDMNFNIYKNKLLAPGTFYVASTKKTGLLVFIKQFQDSLWCTFPNSFYSLGEKRVNSLNSFSKYISTDDFEIFIENFASSNAADVTDNNSECLNVTGCSLSTGCSVNNGESLNVTGGSLSTGSVNNEVSLNVTGCSLSTGGSLVLVTSFDQIKEGDSIVIAPRGSLLKEFIERFYSYQTLSISLDSLTIPLFIKRNLSESALKQEIHRHFHSSQISYDGPNPNEKNKINCSLSKNHYLYYVGIQTSSIFDINLIDHVHSFVLHSSATAKDLIKQFRLSSFPCMGQLQNEQDLIVVEAHRKSTNLKIHHEDNVLDPRMGFLVVQKRMKVPLKVSFYTGMYEMINYPFFLENPGSIRDLRMKYFFSNRIVKFNGSSYVDCLTDDCLILMPNETLLIEKN